MTESDGSSAPNRFAGFISYSQKDKAWAMRIHRALEAYRLPTGLPGGAKGKRLGRFFRDDDELAGAPSLGDALERALDDSGALIVICSPNAARSKWVDAEIRRFKSRGDDARVFAVIVAGRPDAEDPDEACFPPSLLYRVDADGALTDIPDEPLAPDVTKDSFPRLIARLAAGLIGVEFDTLWQREKRRRTRRRIVLGGVAAALIAAAGVGTWMLRAAQDQQLRAEAAQLAGQAQVALDDGRRADALADIAAALPDDLTAPDRPVVPEALLALRRAMADSPARGVLARLDSPVRALRQTPAGHLAVFLDSGAVQVIDTDGALGPRLPPEPRYAPLGRSGLAFSQENSERQIEDGTWVIEGRAQVVDPDTGAVLGRVATRDPGWWLEDVLSHDGRRILARDRRADDPRYGIFALGDEDDPAARPVATIDLAMLDGGMHVSAGFGAGGNVFLSSGDKRRTLIRWAVDEGRAGALVGPSDTEPGCDATAAVDPFGRDAVSLSPDGALVTHARPLEDDGWCVRIWDAQSGRELPPLILDDVPASGVMALTRDVVAVNPDGTSWRAEAMLRGTDGQVWPLPECGGGLFDALRLDPPETGWITDWPARVTACASGEAIAVQSGPGMQPVGGYTGHEGDVGALWLDAEAGVLWSGGQDGTVRHWDVPDAPVLAVQGQAFGSLATDGARVGGLFFDVDDVIFTQVFEADGQVASAPVAVPLAPVPEGASTPDRRAAPLLLQAGQVFGIAQRFDCGFFGCPEGFENRLSLWRVADGALLAQVDGVQNGDFLERVPVAIHVGGGAALLRMVDGTAQLIDLETGDVAVHAPPEGQSVTDAAFAFGGWWLAESDISAEPEARFVRLLRLEGDTVEEVDRRQAQWLRLDADAGALLATFSYAHTQRLTLALESWTADGTSVPAGDLPAAAQSLERVVFDPAGRQAALTFGQGVAPLSLDLQSGALRPLGVTQTASFAGTWFVPDPLGRALFSTHDDVLSIVAVDDTAPICPKLVGTPVDAAALSPDGATLALSHEGVVRIHDLTTCAVQRVIEARAGISSGSLAYGGDGTLWIRQEDRALRLVPPLGPDADLLAALRREIAR